MNYHIPVLLHECIDGLQLKPDGTYLDLTFGGGGHTQEILKRLKGGRVIAFDQDSDAKNNNFQDNRLSFVQGNFRFFHNYLIYNKVGQVDGILADLGLSSHHLNTLERGFSFRYDGGLDMRMNQKAEKTAQSVLNSYSQTDLRRVFFEYGEIQKSARLAELVVMKRTQKEILTASQLKEAIAEVIPNRDDFKFLAKVFQALRIEVNDEILCLTDMLKASIPALKNGGRLVIVSYHSLEDRTVKRFFRTGNFEGDVKKDFYGNAIAPFKVINTKVIVPGESEINTNSRARSAKLRIAEKL